MAQRLDGARVQEHPEALTLLDGLGQERVDDAQRSDLAAAHLVVVLGDEADMVAGIQILGSEDGSGGDVDGIALVRKVGRHEATELRIGHAVFELAGGDFDLAEVLLLRHVGLHKD